MEYDEIIKALRKGEFPNDDLLKDFPFGNELIQLSSSPDHAEHVRTVVKKMSQIVVDSPVAILSDSNNPNNTQDLGEFINVWEAITNGKKGIFVEAGFKTEESKDFLLIAALFHDIGKVIQRDRHALEGYHYLKNVKRDEYKKLEAIIKNKKAELLCHLIKYHDLFGVISTGEGSLLVLIDAMKSHTTSIVEQKMILSYLLFLNLADISGTISLTTSLAARIARDWKTLCDIIDESEGDKQRINISLMCYEQNQKRAVDRIFRLLNSTCPAHIDCNTYTISKVGELLEIATGNNFYDFWNDFPLISKIDYGLRFLKKFQQYGYKINAGSDRIVEIIILLIRELIQSYSLLTKRQDKSRRRIGVEIMGWTRTEGISNSLIELLYEDDTKGLSWAREEATAWYFD